MSRLVQPKGSGGSRLVKPREPWKGSNFKFGSIRIGLGPVHPSLPRRWVIRNPFPRTWVFCFGRIDGVLTYAAPARKDTVSKQLATHLEVRRESEGLSRAIVRIEVDGCWVEIINTLHVDGGHTSEIVEPTHVEKCIAEQWHAEA